MKRTLMTLFLGLVAVGVAAGTAWATVPGVTTTLTVQEAHTVGGCVAGQQTIDATGDLVIENKSGAPITLVSAAFALYEENDLTGPINGTVLVTGAGSIPGAVILDNANLTLNNLQFTITLPCDTNQAYLCVSVAVLNQQATTDSCAPLITNGVPIPAGTIGLIGLSALLGVGLVAVPVIRRQRRRRVGVPQGA